ncbi:MAG: hypothetical protein KJ601_02500, partial [Nanoarchaeota archaeon]|nr:hypothetical protein [Nanoarchaeota archaeon]
KVGSFGGIEATNAGIHKQKGVEGAIKNMITGAEEQGIMTQEHSENMRDEKTGYGEHLENEKKLLSDRDKEKKQKQLNETNSAITEIEGSHSGFETEEAKSEVLQNLFESRAEAAKPLFDKDATVDEKKDAYEKMRNISDAIKGIREIGIDKGLSPADSNKLEEKKEERESLVGQLANGDKSMSFAEVAKKIDQTKIDSMAGQALGIQQNIDDKGVNYAQNAMYGEESKQQGMKKTIDTLGGVDNAVALSVAEAGQKTSQQKGAVEALQSQAEETGKKIGKAAAQVMEDAAKSAAALKATQSMSSSEALVASGLQDAEYNTTKKGQEAIDSAEYKDKGLQAEKGEVFNNAKAIKNNAGDWIDKAVGEDKKNIANDMQRMGLVKKPITFNKETGLVNRDSIELGNAKETAMALGRAEGNKLTDKMTSFVFGGTSFKNTGDTNSASYDNSSKGEIGQSFKANLANQSSFTGQKAEEGAKIGMDPTRLIPLIAGHAATAVSESLQASGMSKDMADGTVAGVAVSGGLITAAGALEVGQRVVNAHRGKRVAKETFSYDTGKTGKDDKPVMELIEKGKSFSTKDNPELKEYLKDNPKVSGVEGGTPSKLLGAGYDVAESGLKSVSDFALESVGAKRFSYTGDSTKDDSRDHKNDGTGGSGEEKVNNGGHNELLKSDDTIVSKDANAVKNPVGKATNTLDAISNLPAGGAVRPPEA